MYLSLAFFCLLGPNAVLYVMLSDAIFPQREVPNFRPHKKTDKIIFLYVLIDMFDVQFYNICILMQWLICGPATTF